MTDTPVSPTKTTSKHSFINPDILAPNSAVAGALKENLRQQIQASSTLPSINQESLSSALVNVAETCLQGDSHSFDADELGFALNAAFELLRIHYQQADISRNLRRQRFICETGVVISPDHGITTIKDVYRVRAFIRGLDQAIAQWKENNEGVCHVVYPACGPFAPLLLPLISLYQKTGQYSEKDIAVSLIDIQPGAVNSVKSLVQTLGLEHFIREIVSENAIHYQSATPIHIVLLEALQHGLSREGHVAIAMHFAHILEPEGIMLPEKITVHAALAIGQKEFVEQWRQLPEESLQAQEDFQKSIRAERIELGSIITLTKFTLRSMLPMEMEGGSNLLECGSITIPELSDNSKQYILILYCQLQTFGEEHLAQYQSGITHPLPDMQVCINFVPNALEAGDILAQSGDALKFYYCLNGLPGFLPVVESPHADVAPIIQGLEA